MALLSRRNFLKGGILLGGALMLDGVFVEPKKFRIEKTDVEINGLGPGLDGFTICQITDVHHSPFVGLGYIKEAVEAANSLKPDLTVLTGDYVDSRRRYLPPAIKALSGLKARFGVVSILGNHDHYIDKDFSVEVIERHRVPLLENSHMMIEAADGALCIAGVKDFLEDLPDAGAALKGVDEKVPRILLSHHPDYSEFLPPEERIDLVLSGHTHGGQVRLPFSIAPVVPSNYGRKYSGGLVRLNRRGATPVYVSRGIGTVGIPVRINCPPELTLIRLIPKGAAPGRAY